MLAERLKQLRSEKGMTQVQLAQMLGVSKGTVAMWETSKRKPSFEILSKLSDIFDRRMDYILGYSDDASSLFLDFIDSNRHKQLCLLPYPLFTRSGNERYIGTHY